MDSVMLDTLDLQLLHALQLDGRAPFSKIAEVLDVSDRTVARRFGRLRVTGAARVTGAIDSHLAGHAEWLVRLRVHPRHTTALARALARRPDTAWVSVLSSGAEIVCIVRVAGGGPAPLESLARHPQILDVTAQRLLRHLMDRRWLGRTSALTAEQITALRPPGTGDPTAVALTDLDRRLLPALAADGRAAYPGLAREVGWSESAVRRRLDELRRSRVLQLDVEVDPALFGFSVQCLLWLTVTPSRLTAVTRTLAAGSETAFVGATTGERNLIAIVICRDSDGLYTCLTDRIGTVPGVEGLETALITSYTKRVAPTP
ncbi:Lrp/AsnC family transcriptional regulator [Amycolatopsis sp. A133]|uniref:Lrp/AsnC family transcriptional regulator n=1 Tax=Amycolatopsis sp. A133 TaxID=3064472 RepID=UPI0027F81FE6|nr:Lrp/AsnC family transcriptional regulator [Amycolatopsis sp. A133]MDQ7806851.1 Lrp/AsnC family transcriptional regulator [Amycolatopsis sp. A133]